jgi:hypothetical protein
VNDQTNWTSFAVLALRAAGVVPPPATLSWLVRQQDADGGFNFATRGGQSDVDDTGAALEALASVSGSAAARDRARAIRYIQSQQDRDGGFPAEPGAGSNAQSTAFAVQGLLAVGVNPSSVRRGGGPSALDYLRSLIAADGHVRYSRGNDQTPTWVTGEALMALERKPLPVAAPARRTARASAPHRTAHTTSHTAARPAVAPAPAHRVVHRAPPRRRLRRTTVLTASPTASAADGLAADAGILTALSLAFVGGS